MTRAIWFIAGWICVLLAIIGAILPLMPSVVFLLLAAFAFSNSSPRFHDWLLNHDKFGPPIKDWHERGAISKKSKILANCSIFLTLVISIVLKVSPTIIMIQVFILALVLLFINTRPE